MTIGIIGAMESEVRALKDMMTDCEVKEIASLSFYHGTLCGRDAVVVMCGIGKVNAALCAQILINLYNVDYVINTGVAGSLRPEINIGDVVLSTDALEHDMDVSYLGYAPGVIPDMAYSIFNADERLRTLAMNTCKEVLPELSVFTGRVVSGDQFISSKEKKEWLIETFQGSCTEMEGAAIAHVASLNNIPFLVVRAISDKADDSASMDYPTFVTMAVANSIKLMTALLPQI